jgi:hypothetical protein
MLRVEEDLTPDVAGYFGVGTGVALIATFLSGAVLMTTMPLAALLAPAIPLGLWAGARKLFRTTHARREDELHRLADRLAARAEEPIR